MNTKNLLYGALITLAACTVNQPTGDENVVPEPAPTTVECIQCGDGCIPKDLAPLTLCQQSDKIITCVYENNACTVKE